jgi:hypothetical protein
MPAAAITAAGFLVARASGLVRHDAISAGPETTFRQTRLARQPSGNPLHRNCLLSDIAVLHPN